MKYWFITLLTSWMAFAQAEVFDDELLPVEQAFALQVELIGDDRIRAEWSIAEGYYLYRSKIRFSTDAQGIQLGEAQLPDGKKKQDEFFGEVETYRDRVVAEIPVQREAGAADRFELRATSQGCADIGVCYPPHTVTVALTLPAASGAGGPSGGALQALSDFGTNLGFGSEPELLPADQAFQLDVQLADENTLVANWTIAEGYYLYRHKFEFAVDAASGIVLQAAQLNAGEKKNDEFFGAIEVYHLAARASLPFQRSTADAVTAKLTVKYQGCAEIGVCYPPISKVVEVLIPAAGAADATRTPPPAADRQAPALSEQDALAQRLQEGHLLATLLVFFGSGLLLAFTPCVFPMIPILSSIIVGQGKDISTARSFTLSLVYVLAMAFTYTVAGVLAGLFGENLQAYFQNPWILSAFAAVFVLLALSMFGFYELQMPAFIQSRLTEASNRQQGGSLTGVAIMGFLSALIVGPCVAAPLMAALIVIGQTGDAVLGGLALFALSMGMGAPLIAIGTGAGKLLPRAGQWMDAIKAVFGVLLLAVAIWMLERILPPAVTLALWAALLILSAIFMRALDQLPVEASGWSRLWKGVGVVGLVYGVLLLVGASSGARDPLQPLQGVFGANVAGTPASEHALPFKRIKTVADLERELDAARSRQQPVMVDFYADWCVSCKEMEKYTFGTAEVQQALSGFLLLQADVTANDADDKALLKHYRLIGPPSILFYDRSGAQRPELNLVGYKPAEAFVSHLQGLN